MNGDLSLSQALGGLRIANPDSSDVASPPDTSPPPENSSASPPPAPPAIQLPSPRELAPSANRDMQNHPPSHSDVRRQLQPTQQGQPQYHPQHLKRSHTDEQVVNMQQQQHQQQLFPDPQFGRPTSAVYASHAHPDKGLGPGPYRQVSGPGPGPSAFPHQQPSGYGFPVRSDSRTAYSPGSRPSRELSQHVPHRDVPPNSGRMLVTTQKASQFAGPSPPLPRMGSRGGTGGYALKPQGNAQMQSQGIEGPLPTSSEEWRDRGAARAVRREVDANGNTVVRHMRKGVRDFSFNTLLGEGSYSVVYHATDRQTHKDYAIKVLQKRHIIKEKKIKYVSIEKDTLNRLTDHPGIVRLYYTFQDETSLYYVLDVCSNGELLGVLKKVGTFDEECTRFYGAQILDAVEYMHSRGVIHRDLKPENVLLDGNMHVKITDFGTAKLLRDPRQPLPPSGADPPIPGESDKAASFVGTAEYVSPELLTDKSACKASDLWAFGCIIYQLLAGRPPFKAGSEYLTFQQIVNLDYKFPDGFPPAARDLVERLLVLDPNSRLTIEHIKNHEFFRGQSFGRQLWKTKAPRLRPYIPPPQEPRIIPLSPPTLSHHQQQPQQQQHQHQQQQQQQHQQQPPQQQQQPHQPPPQQQEHYPDDSLHDSSSKQYQSLSRHWAANANGSTPRPPMLITELPPPSQLDIEWSPVLTRSNERILKLGDLMVVSSPMPHGPNGKSDDAHKKLSRFFGGGLTKKRQRLVMVTSSGRIVLAPPGGENKRAKQEISLLGSDCAWRTQTDAKGQTVWMVDSHGVHYVFEEPKNSNSGAESSSLGAQASANEWIEKLEQAKDMAVSQQKLFGNSANNDHSLFGGEGSSALTSSNSASTGVKDLDSKHQQHGKNAGHEEVVKRNRFSKRHSKSGLGSAF